MYKRPGHRVIINSRGDLIVRPSYAEASVQRVPGGTLPSVTSIGETAACCVTLRILSYMHKPRQRWQFKAF